MYQNTQGVPATDTPSKIDQEAGGKITKITPSFNGSFIKNDPLNARLQELAPAPKNFPIQVFPQAVRDIITAWHHGIGYPLDFGCAGVLSAVSAAIGNSCKGMFNGAYEVLTILYVVLVANPGINKSQSLGTAYKPLDNIDAKLYEEYISAMKFYEEQKAAFAREKSTEQPKKPILRKTIVRDCTLEAATQVLSFNRRGIVSYSDEMAGFFKNMNRYTKGSDQEAWLQFWSGVRLTVDRIGKEPVSIPDPWVSLVGTIQPAVLDEIAKDNRSQNGFTDRILFVYPKGLERSLWPKMKFDPTFNQRWGKIIKRLTEIDFNVDRGGAQVSNYLLFSARAEEILMQWQEKNKYEDEQYSSTIIDGISAKMEIYVLRFALILQLLRWACGETDNKSEIDAVSAQNAILLAEYFKGQALDISQYINNKSPVSRLGEHKERIYMELPAQFNTGEGQSLAESHGMSSRAFDYWLKDQDLFKKIKHGVYEKVHKS